MATDRRGRSMSRVVRSVAHRTRPPARPAVVFNPARHAPLPPRPITVEQYHQLIDADVLTSSDKVELINGWIVEKMPNNPPHRKSVMRVYNKLFPLLGQECYLTCQLPITLPNSEPEPDFCAATGPEEKYDSRHP